MALAPTPTDEELIDFEAHDVFFSITNTKGVITHANEVFVRLSRYTEEDLVGAPHNIIRHDDMPGGAFALMWDTLEQGQAASAYVSNTAQDGARYDVFATIVPVGENYLSIRLRPELTELHTTVLAAYDAARTQERAAREQGSSKAEAAQVGAAHLKEAMAGLGYTGLDDLARRVLPQELLAHLGEVTTQPSLTEGPLELRGMIEAATTVERELRRFVAGLTTLEKLATEASERGVAVNVMLEQLVALREDVVTVKQLLPEVEIDEEDRTEGPTVPGVVSASERIEGLLDTATQNLHDVPESLVTVTDSTRDLAMRVSLLVLDAIMVARFGAELVQAAGRTASDADADSDSDSSTEAPNRSEEIGLLHRALADGGTGLGWSIEQIRHLQTSIPQALSTAVSAVDRSRRRLSNWVGDIETLDEAGQLGEHAEQIRTLAAGVGERSRAGGGILDELVNVAVRLEMVSVEYNSSLVELNIRMVGDVAATLE